MAMLGVASMSGVPPFGYQQHGWRHVHPHLFCFPAVVDQGEYLHSFFSEKFLRTAQGVIEGGVAGLLDQSVTGHGAPGRIDANIIPNENYRGVEPDGT